ncbi:MAG TPA: amidase [Gammaproteobacteria bacterium]|nr:amidase [Gammaproteobacteria bacterium]
MTDLAFQSGLQLGKAIRDKTISATEMLEYFLDRVDQYNPALNAIVVEDFERAREFAKEADRAIARGEDWGPLHGVPITLKESYEVAGLITTRGNPMWKDKRATDDALPVTRLKQLGVNLFGKTNVPYNLADMQSYNDIYGTTNNPWDHECSPGGSSGGSAATLAAGMTGLECGSDIGGSIRNPAHFCGVFGHKPTWGLLPPRGHAAPGVLAQSDLTVIGPLARSAVDLEVATLAMAGPDEIQSAGYKLALQPCPHQALAGFRVAVWQNDERAPVTEETCKRIDAVVQAVLDAGGTVDYDARPEVDIDGAHENYATLLAAVMTSRNSHEDYRNLQNKLKDPGTSDVQKTQLRYQLASYRDYALANEVRTRSRWAWYEFFQSWDVMIMPVMTRPAFAHDHRPVHERTLQIDNQMRSYFDFLFWAGPAINNYLPATVIPTGAVGDGLPIGVQIMGPEYGDLKTIGFAKLLEQAGFGFVAPPGY